MLYCLLLKTCELNLKLPCFSNQSIVIKLKELKLYVEHEHAKDRDWWVKKFIKPVLFCSSNECKAF